jgi:hypothetical protein
MYQYQGIDYQRQLIADRRQQLLRLADQTHLRRIARRRRRQT